VTPFSPEKGKGGIIRAPRTGADILTRKTIDYRIKGRE
jgi:hypothetical protein